MNKRTGSHPGSDLQLLALNHPLLKGEAVSAQQLLRLAVRSLRARGRRGSYPSLVSLRAAPSKFICDTNEIRQRVPMLKTPSLPAAGLGNA